MSYIARPLAIAVARSRAGALVTVSSSCAAIIPVLTHTGRGVVPGDRRHDAGPPSVVPHVASRTAALGVSFLTITPLNVTRRTHKVSAPVPRPS